MEVGAALVADSQASEPGQPSEGTLHDPPMAAQPGAAFDTTPCDAWRDAAGAALTATAAVVVSLIGVELGGPTARTSPVLGPHARYRIQGGRQHTAVVAVGAAQRQAKRRALGIRDEVALRARLAAVRRVRPNLDAPFWRAGWYCPAPPGSSPGRPRPAVAPAEHGAVLSKPRRHATRPAFASRSCRSSPVRSAPHATGCPFAARTRCPPALHGRAHAACHLSASAAPAAAAVPPPPRGHQERGEPSLLNASARVLSLAFRPRHFERLGPTAQGIMVQHR